MLSKEEIEKEQLQPTSKLGYRKEVSDFGDQWDVITTSHFHVFSKDAEQQLLGNHIPDIPHSPIPKNSSKQNTL